MEFVFVYCLGGVLYALLETLWRGWTHWTMVLCGGACFTLMYLVSMAELPPRRKWLLSAAGITTIEFFTGCLVNLRLGWQVWDYSKVPFNILGQICPGFIGIWLLLSIPGMWICTRLRRLLSQLS